MAEMPGSENRLRGWQAGRGGEGCLLVEVLDAVDEAACVHGERDPVQAAMAHHTGEAVRVIGLPGGSENPLHDGLGAHAALLQGILERKRETPRISQDLRLHVCSNLRHDQRCYRARGPTCLSQSVFTERWSVCVFITKRESQSDGSGGFSKVTQVTGGKCII